MRVGNYGKQYFDGMLNLPAGESAAFRINAMHSSTDGWLDDAATVMSIALVPLRAASGPAFGLLVLGSPDPTRYAAEMGTEFLARVGEIASAGLSRLLPAF